MEGTDGGTIDRAGLEDCEGVVHVASLPQARWTPAFVKRWRENHRKGIGMVIKCIPESHQDLIDGPYVIALSTVMPDGHPQTTPVWCNRQDDCIFINVMKGFRKEKNMRLNPKVSLLAYDPKAPLRNIEIRGCVVEMTEEGAVEHDDELARLYLGKPDAKFFGDAVPAELESRYTPVRVKIAPTHIRVEG